MMNYFFLGALLSSVGGATAAFGSTGFTSERESIATSCVERNYVIATFFTSSMQIR